MLGRNTNAPIVISGSVIARVITVLAFMGIVGWVTTGIYTLPAGTAAVVSQSGKTKVVSDPGWHFANPSGIAASDIIKVNLNRPSSVEFGFRTKVAAADGRPAQYTEVPIEAENLTRDSFYVHAEAVVNLIPTDPFKWVYGSRSREDLIRAIVASSMIRGFGERSLDEGLSSKIQGDIQEEVRNNVDAFLKSMDLGAKVQSVNLQNVKAPTSVMESYNKVATAKSQAEADIKTAETQYNTGVANATADATIKKAEADKYFSLTVGSANGAAQQFASWYEQYKANPELAGKKLYWEALEKLISRKGIQIYLMREDGSTVKYLPLTN
ncbi:MAG TPA: SPFH domain-containing protein [Symbiobacteriaceae bacterium]|jgi:membrane protease subunit HflK